MPIFVQYIQALAPTALAFAGLFITAAIQYRQWKTAQDKLRLDLFDRRYAIFLALNAEIDPTTGDVGNLSKQLETINNRVIGFEMLFPKKLSEKIWAAKMALMILISDLRKPPPFDHSKIIGQLNEFQEIRDHLRLPMSALMTFVS